MNYEYDPDKPIIRRYNKHFDFKKFDDHIVQHKEELDLNLCMHDVNEFVEHLDRFIVKAHEVSKTNVRVEKDNAPVEIMNEVNEKFKELQNALKGKNDIEINRSYENYLTSRKKLNTKMLSTEHLRWTNLLKGDTKKLWKNIDWNGKLKNKGPDKHPSVRCMHEHFEELYTPEDPEEMTKIRNLNSDVYVPILDDPIAAKEIEDAMKDCKKGGFDYQLPVLRTLTNRMMPMLILLFNTMFYMSYPVQLALSLLIAIPKVGNLLDPNNFRGIQMLRAISVLYDRVISKRFEQWMYIHDQQTGFQKGKSTNLQTFLLRLIIELAKKHNIPLYIGCFDIQKAFDKVSRLKLFQKLIKLGIGHAMLGALKSIYTTTRCIISIGNETSDMFETKCGIRQGAPSSSLLFISFINDLIDYMNVNCIPELIIDTIHVLLHADDTLILSTSETSFVSKCNIMLQYFKENKLNLNLKKSGYLVITKIRLLQRKNILINNGLLKYKEVLKYLGIFISDSGSVKLDSEIYIKEVRNEIYTKYTNYCAAYYLAPLSIKLKTLNTCIVPILLHGCECWGDVIPSGLEVAYRMAIKTALSIRTNTCNEIVYIESGLYPLEIIIKKRQLSFWLSIQQSDDNIVMNNVLRKAFDENLKFVKYYENLRQTYQSPKNLERVHRTELMQRWKDKINDAYQNDQDSTLGTYKKVTVIVNCNDEHLENYNTMFELERIT